MADQWPIIRRDRAACVVCWPRATFCTNQFSALNFCYSSCCTTRSGKLTVHSTRGSGGLSCASEAVSCISIVRPLVFALCITSSRLGSIRLGRVDICATDASPHPGRPIAPLDWPTTAAGNERGAQLARSVARVANCKTGHLFSFQMVCVAPSSLVHSVPLSLSSSIQFLRSHIALTRALALNFAYASPKLCHKKRLQATRPSA